jgi:phage gp29-like protein
MAFTNPFRRKKPPTDEPRRDPDVPAGATPPTDAYSDIPVSNLGDWSVSKIRGALTAHQTGSFAASALLTEAMLADDRVQSSLNGRIKGVTMRHLHTTPVKGAKGKQAADLVTRWWSRIFSDELLDQLMMWSTFMGFALCEVLWTTEHDSDGNEVYVPYLKVWHPQFIYYDVFQRRYVAITQDGNVVVDENDPKWFLFTPWGRYRGWLRGAVRSCSAPWIMRQFSRRDWARFCEVHGLPIRAISAPAQSHAVDKARFFSQVQNLGASSTLILPQQAGQDGQRWGLDLIEAKDTSWEAFLGMIDNCDKAIQLAIRGTNLTSEVQGGSYAAAQVHSDEDTSYADSDCRKLCAEAGRLMAWFVAYNVGDPSVAPALWLEPPDNQDTAALAQSQVNALAVIEKAKTLGIPLDVAAYCERYNLPLEGEAPDLTEAPEEPADDSESDGYDEPDVDVDEPEQLAAE